MTRPTDINLNLNEYNQGFFNCPFMFNSDRCNANCDTLDNTPSRVSISNNKRCQFKCF